MNRIAIIGISAAVVLAGGTGGYLYWQHQPEPEATPAEAPVPLVEDKPEFPLKLVEAPAQTPLPSLSDSDAFVAEALNTLLANEELMPIFINEKMIQHFVATVDNLPSKSLPLEVLPIHTAEGSFIINGSGKNISISPDNAARYHRYLQLADAANSQQLVQLYLRLYPLMQSAYEELGYPDKYFNDRLMWVIDDLLAAPDVNEPIKLAQPFVVYQFADPELENKSIGQRIMLRIGKQHQARLKTRLREIREELLKHIQETEVIQPD